MHRRAADAVSRHIKWQASIHRHSADAHQANQKQAVTKVGGTTHRKWRVRSMQSNSNVKQREIYAPLENQYC